MITQERLKELLSYDRETGQFIRKQSRMRPDRVGRVAGCHSDGYIEIGVDGKIYKAHRLAWLYEYGGFPKGGLDHKNRVRDDNRIENLRESTKAQNAINSPDIGKRKTSQYKGVFWHKHCNKWAVCVSRNHWIGLFDDEIEAAKAYDKSTKDLYGEFAWLNF